MAGITLNIANLYPELTLYAPTITGIHIITVTPDRVQIEVALRDIAELPDVTIGPVTIAIEDSLLAPALILHEQYVSVATVVSEITLIDPVIMHEQYVAPSVVAGEITLIDPTVWGIANITPSVVAIEADLPAIKLVHVREVNPDVIAISGALVVHTPTIIAISLGQIWDRSLGQITFNAVGQHVSGEPMDVENIIVSATSDAAYLVTAEGDRPIVLGTTTSAQRMIVWPINKRVHSLLVKSKPAGTIIVQLQTK